MGFPSIPQQQRAVPRRIGDAFVEGLDGNLVGVLPGHQHLRRWPEGQGAALGLFFMGKMAKSWGKCGKMLGIYGKYREDM